MNIFIADKNISFFQIDSIVGEHGLVVITREGSNPNKFIYDSDILSKHMVIVYLEKLYVLSLHPSKSFPINLCTA